MVTKTDMDNSMNKLSSTLTDNFKKMLDESINELKNTIIDNLKKSNEMLQMKVTALENEVTALKESNIDLVKRTEAGFQHGRLNQIILSGVPADVKHEDLEEQSIKILNQIKIHKINERDVAACHRVGKNHDTILRFVNRKDAEDTLSNRNKLKDLDRRLVGLDRDINIYVKQNLSPYMNKLAYYCRVLKRSNLVEKVTSFKGVIKVTRKVGPDGSRMVTSVIGHKQDLLKFCPNLDEVLNMEAS